MNFNSSDGEIKALNSQLSKRIKEVIEPVNRELEALGKSIRGYMEKRMGEYRKAWPLGFDCYELFMDKNPSYIYKLKYATFKELKKRGQKVRFEEYEGSDDRLFVDDIEDEPEVFFNLILGEALSKESRMNTNVPELIEKLNEVPSHTWDFLRYYIERHLKAESIEEEDTAWSLSHSLAINFVIKNKVGSAKQLAAIDELSKKEREVMELIYHEDKKYRESEVAIILGIKRQSVHETHKRAREKLEKARSKN